MVWGGCSKCDVFKTNVTWCQPQVFQRAGSSVARPCRSGTRQTQSREPKMQSGINEIFCLFSYRCREVGKGVSCTLQQSVHCFSTEESDCQLLYQIHISAPPWVIKVLWHVQIGHCCHHSCHFRLNSRIWMSWRFVLWSTIIKEPTCPAVDFGK